MGAASTHIDNSTNYVITGSNNGLDSGSKNIGTASSSATNDVSPNIDVNYSPGVNPSWLGNLATTGLNGLKKLTGYVANNTDLVSTVKHIGAAFLRTKVEDTEASGLVKNFVSNFLTKSTADGAAKSNERVELNDITTIANMQADVIEALPQANNDYATLALGMSGMRNRHVSTKPTDQSMVALLKRASPQEKARKDVILKVAGPRMGVIPIGTTDQPSSLISETIQNKETEYGKVGVIRELMEDQTKISKLIDFRVLHANAQTLSEARVLRTGIFETNQFVGIILQNMPVVTASISGTGHYFQNKDLNPSKVDIKAPTETILTGTNFGVTRWGYSLADNDSDTSVVVQVSGEVCILNQNYDPSAPMQAGFLWKDKNGLFRFNPGVFINLDLLVRGGTARPIVNAASSNYAALSTNEDLTSRYVNKDGLTTNIMMDTSGNMIVRANSVVANSAIGTANDGRVFSYVSTFAAFINLSECVPFKQDDVFTTGLTDEKKVNCLFVVRYPTNFSFNITAQSPVLYVSVVQNPTSMRDIGKKYYGSVIDRLGTIPNWYSSVHPLELVSVYYQVIEPLIPWASRIAEVFTANEDAPYNFCSMIVQEQRVVSNLPPLNLGQMRVHINDMITGIARWMSSDGPVAEYTIECRKRLFMQIVEKIMFEKLTNASVYLNKTSLLVNKYLEDCNEYNTYTDRLDKQFLAITA